LYTSLFGLIAAIILYAGGFMINSYLYAPHWLKELMRKVPIAEKLLDKHEYHHIHFHEHHDNSKHEGKEKELEKYILKSLDSGHELFYIVENLVEHNWPVETIEKAVNMAKHDKLFKKEVKHVMHYHHNKDRIKSLAEWIKDTYSRYNMKEVIDTALNSEWSEDDLIHAFRMLKGKLRIREKDKEIMKYMYVVH
jgi:hypothetical protein